MIFSWVWRGVDGVASYHSISVSLKAHGTLYIRACASEFSWSFDIGMTWVGLRLRFKFKFYLLYTSPTGKPLQRQLSTFHVLVFVFSYSISQYRNRCIVVVVVVVVVPVRSRCQLDRLCLCTRIQIRIQHPAFLGKIANPKSLVKVKSRESSCELVNTGEIKVREAA